MEILITASFIASFVAGVAALFAPCCITVLLPAYLASIFRQKRTVLLMTFIFFLGLLAVFLPLGLGIGGLGQIFSEYHNTLFVIGGVFLLLLGTFLLLGRHFSMPFTPKHKANVSGGYSIFGLGVFSGFATLCCAPVLAGVLTLAALPGSILWGGIYTLTYVLGMVVPLFFLAYFLDKTDFAKKFWVFKKKITYKIFGKSVSLRLADALSGVVFLAMGFLILYLAATDQLAVHSSYQTSMNIFMSGFTDTLGGYFGQVPGLVWAAIVIVALALIVKVSLKKWHTE